MPQKTVRLQDVALAAGVSLFTASQALAGKSGVSATTRARVEKIARTLGYAVNPAASLLAKQRAERVGMKRLLVAVVYGHRPDLKSCQISAERVGLDLRGWKLEEFGSAQEAARVLWHQGVGGLLLNVHELTRSDMQMDAFAWERFSLVKTSRGLPEVPCHLVRLSAFDYMTLALRQLVQRGFRKIAVVMQRSDSEQDDDARLGAFRAFQERHTPAEVRLSWLEDPGNKPATLDSKTHEILKREQPDAVLGYHWTMWFALHDLGWKMPEELGFAAVLSTSGKIENTPQVSGCDVQQEEHYERALRILADLMARSQRGFPERPMEHVLEPVWVEGETLGEGDR